MDNNEEKEIIKVLHEYAFSLSSAQSNSIAAFYLEDGLFMPEGLKTFSKVDLSKNESGDYLKRMDFKIEYTEENIVVNDDYAFVSTVAKTSTRNSLTDDISRKTSRDFFVLRKRDNNWKIYRYIFNKVSGAN